MMPTEATPLADRRSSYHGAKVKTGNFWISAEEEMEWAAQKYGESSRAMQYLLWLNSHNIQICIVLLLIIDVIVVVVELFLDAEYPPCHIIERDAISCFDPSANDTLAPHHLLRRLSSSDDAHASHAVCAAGLVDTSTPAACDPHKWATAHAVHEVLFAVSVAILATFGVELFTLLALLQFHFVRNPLYLIDAVVVAVSLSLELALKGQAGAELAGALAFARAWRFLRIGHGLATSVHETGHTHAQHLEEEIDELKLKLKRAKHPEKA